MMMKTEMLYAYHENCTPLSFAAPFYAYHRMWRGSRFRLQLHRPALVSLVWLRFPQIRCLALASNFPTLCAQPDVPAHTL
jgi:hypothetical protein